MKESLLILALLSVVVLSLAATHGSGKTGEAKAVVHCECTCPTLEQLLKEKSERELQERKDRAAYRVQIIKDKFHLWGIE